MASMRISRHQKQGYVWFLPWWHVLIWPIKNFAFSFFYIKPATVSSRAFVLCRMAQNILGQKLKRFQLKSSNPFVYARPVPLRKYQHPVLPPGNGPMVREGLLCELTFKWYVTESDLCLPGFTPCGCEEEHPPLHQRRCLGLVLTSYNCQSLFQVLSSHLPFSSTGVRAAPGMDSPLGFSRRITDGGPCRAHHSVSGWRCGSHKSSRDKTTCHFVWLALFRNGYKPLHRGLRPTFSACKRAGTSAKRRSRNSWNFCRHHCGACQASLFPRST